METRNNHFSGAFAVKLWGRYSKGEESFCFWFPSEIGSFAGASWETFGVAPISCCSWGCNCKSLMEPVVLGDFPFTMSGRSGQIPTIHM